MTRPQQREIHVWLLLTFVAILIYLVWPELDLLVAKQFYTPGVGFEVDQLPIIRLWHNAVPWMGRLILVGTLLMLIFGQHISVTTRRKAFALTVSLLIGLWLIMHVGFKDHWGRPRPSQLSVFGATEAYSPPLIPSSACDSNCSFMSGHAGTGFVLIGWGALATTRVRRRWLAIGWATGTVLGIVRIAQGGHFLGDIVFGGLLLWACAWVTRWVYVHWRARRIFERQSRL